MNEKSTRFFRLVRDFLTTYLSGQRGLSPNTVKSYRECLNQLFGYVCDMRKIKLSKLSLGYITQESVEGYLEYLEAERHCCVSTRNHRLACIRSFAKYAGARDIGAQALVGDLKGIPLKKEAKPATVKFFSESALETILGQPDPRKRTGMRDLFFMVLMYDTGGRNQEMLDLTLGDIHFETKTPYVVITGKGKKTRLVPLMSKTVEHYKRYAAAFHPEPSSGDRLFYTDRNGGRFAMSPDNAERFIKIYGAAAHSVNPDVPQSLHPHQFRQNGVSYKLVSDCVSSCP